MHLVQEANGFKYTTAIRKLRKLKKRIKKIPGGTSAGKTFGILPVLIQRATKTPLLEISVVSESLPHLRKGAMKDFLKIMKATNRYIDANWSRTLLTYTFANGSYIEFFSADQEDKVRGPRRNILYINECNNLAFETYHQLAIRTDIEIWLDFNPTHEFWAHTELKEDEDVEELILTYKDNEGLSPSIVKEIEKALTKGFYNPELNDLFKDSNIKSQYWSNWWRVYGLGLVGSLEGVIFSNWSKIAKIPKEAVLLGYGMDFGFTNDPTALIGIYRYDGKIILDEMIYKSGLLNSDIIREMKALNVNPRATIYADSAEPKTIEEILRSGFNCRPTVKGSDSINFGISILQEQSILITETSVNLIKEFRNYTWDKDKNGQKLNKPIDDFNHGIDATRYFAMMELKQKPQSFVIVGGKVVYN
jgi:phage terminase large subunit